METQATVIGSVFVHLCESNRGVVADLLPWHVDSAVESAAGEPRVHSLLVLAGGRQPELGQGARLDGGDHLEKQSVGCWGGGYLLWSQ